MRLLGAGNSIYGRHWVNRHPEIASKINQTGRRRDPIQNPPEQLVAPLSDACLARCHTASSDSGWLNRYNHNRPYEALGRIPPVECRLKLRPNLY